MHIAVCGSYVCMYLYTDKERTLYNVRSIWKADDPMRQRFSSAVFEVAELSGTTSTEVGTTSSNHTRGCLNYTRMRSSRCGYPSQCGLVVGCDPDPSGLGGKGRAR